jgi:hypothetical protein
MAQVFNECFILSIIAEQIQFHSNLPFRFDSVRARARRDECAARRCQPHDRSVYLCLTVFEITFADL